MLHFCPKKSQSASETLSIERICNSAHDQEVLIGINNVRTVKLCGCANERQQKFLLLTFCFVVTKAVI